MARAILGVLVPREGDVKCQLYMDDVTVVVRNEGSLEWALHHITDYGETAGAWISREKSTLLVGGIGVS